MVKTGRCESCFYSRPALNPDVVVCTYMDDILNKKGTADLGTKEKRTAEYFVDLTNFSGDAFKAWAVDGEDDEPRLRICVDKNAWCSKYHVKS